MALDDVHALLHLAEPRGRLRLLLGKLGVLELSLKVALISRGHAVVELLYLLFDSSRLFELAARNRVNGCGTQCEDGDNRQHRKCLAAGSQFVASLAHRWHDTAR